MRISDWSSDVCSSDLQLAKGGPARHLLAAQSRGAVVRHVHRRDVADLLTLAIEADVLERHGDARRVTGEQGQDHLVAIGLAKMIHLGRSEEHTSELQSLMRISYAVFCLKKKKKIKHYTKMHTSISY